ncbi:GntR family transcriptional regulator [Herbiconiux sp. KACC 21604]|uniref:GntR family transcriptional regulator n=1 Tax=unclassified Herbiconiux TaxID=2618217 RepID=UPI001491F35E|nr:GntR family transcriptional regulator [Herbiconiux sp. SALV-R1]QJU55121.1 GntR family transcriptional regulator [Herbiconiux sp. SALV-R1]WPO86270.1 GntR family transcriptional regulator [Herbiconiux sp. KACC 21604]
MTINERWPLDRPTDLPSRRHQVAEILRASVLAEQLKPGVVYSAPALGAELGVSATPVREAMIDLAKDGLVEVVRNKGFRVVEPSAAQLAQLLDLRLLIEVPITARIAARGLSDQEYAALLDLADATKAAVEDLDFTGHVVADQHFHLSLLALAGNTEVVETIRVLRSRSRLSGLGREEKRPLLLRSAAEHGELVQLLRDREVDAAERLIGEHIAGVGRAWSSATSDGVGR